jgi:cullin 3
MWLSMKLLSDLRRNWLRTLSLVLFLCSKSNQLKVLSLDSFPGLIWYFFIDLARMYRLYSRIPATLEILKEEMKNHVTGRGSAVVQDEQNKKDPNKFVQELLDLRAAYFAIVDQSFSEDRKFARALKEAFENFINLDARTAQYLSLYVDDLLKKGLMGMSEDVAEQKLDQVVVIFRYLHDKDVFEDFYKKNLATRLLLGKGTSDDLEKLMISKLKAECGHQFTSKLEGMFKNIELSKEINDKFAKHLTTEKSSPDLPDLSVHVLTSGFWPFPSTEPCVLPPILVPRMQQFEAFYNSMHSGHRLTWQTSLGTAQLFCMFKEGLKEIEVQTYQMCIMMLYNEKDSFTYQEIQERTQIPVRELERHILSLAHPKVGILKKKPNVKKVSPTDVFSYNVDFSSKQYRIKIRLLAVSNTEPETDPSGVPEAVSEARKNRVDAAIVRIMKTRQRLEHSNLLAEVMKQLSVRFPADPGFVKKRIESLIEREYLERDKDDRRYYNYLA